MDKIAEFMADWLIFTKYGPYQRPKMSYSKSTDFDENFRT